MEIYIVDFYFFWPGWKAKLVPFLSANNPNMILYQLLVMYKYVSYKGVKTIGTKDLSHVIHWPYILLNKAGWYVWFHNTAKLVLSMDKSNYINHTRPTSDYNRAQFVHYMTAIDTDRCFVVKFKCQSYYTANKTPASKGII